MIYSPHILQKKTSQAENTDDNGHPVIDNSEEWVTVCRCRCDDNSTKEFKNENGDVYRPNFHIVAEPNTIKSDDEIRCLNADGTVRGSGKVYIAKSTNYFNYSELWV